MLRSACAFTWKHASFHVLVGSCFSTRWFIRNWFKTVCLDLFALISLLSVPALFPWVIMYLHHINFCIVFFLFFCQITVPCAAFSHFQCEEGSRAACKQGQSRCWLALYANRSIFRHEDAWMVICPVWHVSLFVMRTGREVFCFLFFCFFFSLTRIHCGICGCDKRTSTAVLCT